MSLLDSVSSLPTFTDVQREYNFEVILPDLWGFLVAGWFLGKYVQSISFGQYNFTKISEQTVATQKRFFPDQLEISSAKMTFVTPVPDLVSYYFATWKEWIVSKKGFYNVASKYKRNIYVILYDRSGIPVNVIALNQAFPVTFPTYNLSYKGDKQVEFEIEFKFEQIKQGLSAAGQGIAGAGGALQTASNAVSKLF